MPGEATALVPSPAFEPLIALVLDSVANPETRRIYAVAMRDFAGWWAANGRPAFTRSSVQAYRAELESRGAKPGSINQKLAVLRRLAREAAANEWLPWETASGILDVNGPRELGTRTGNWLTHTQTQELISLPDKTTLRGKRDRAVLGLLIGCGLRRAEAASITVAHLAQRESRWVIVDLRGKHGRIRTVAVPAWVKILLDDWTSAAAISSGRLLRSLSRHDRIGASLSPQGILDIVSVYGEKAGVTVRPHDLRRTCAKLCRGAGAELEQIQILLGHASIQTTERYLGTRQDLVHAPNDSIKLKV